METELLIRYIAVGVAVLLLGSTVNYGAIWSKIKSYFSWVAIKKNNVKIPENTKESDFLEIVELWHRLRLSCDEYGLKEATAKLDEVFPILNVEE